MIGIREVVTAAAVAIMSGTAYAQTPSNPPAVDTTETSAQLLGGVAAVVNDQVISLSDVAQRARLLLVTIGVPATEENLQQALPRALEELIEERLQIQKATEYEVEVSDEEVEANIRNMAAQNNASIEQFYQQLAQSGINPDTLRSQIRAETAWRRIMSGLYSSRIRISDVQIDGMLNRLKASASEERYQLAEIFLYAPTEQDKQQLVQGANVITEQLRQGARFELAAQQYSNSPTAAVGGDLGWVSPAELDPEVQTVLQSLDPPALTAPIVVEDGVYIYALRGKQDGFDGARDVDLRQVVSPEGNRAALNSLSLDAPSCDAIEATAADEGLIYAPMGRIPESALTEDIRGAIQGIPSGGVSDIIDTPAGPALLFVCDRGQAGVDLPTAEQIEDRLYSQQITMLSQRDLRDLKREATIIRR